MSTIEQTLGADAQALLEHRCQTIPKESLHLPGPDFVERILCGSDRPARVMVSLQSLLGTGRLEEAAHGFEAWLAMPGKRAEEEEYADEVRGVVPAARHLVAQLRKAR